MRADRDLDELRAEALKLLALEIVMFPEDADMPLDILMRQATEIVMDRHRVSEVPEAFRKAFER